MRPSIPVPTGAPSPAERTPAPPPRLVAVGVGLSLLAVLVGQVIIALDLVNPPHPATFFDASHANGTLIANALAAVIIGAAAFLLPDRWRGLAILPGFGLLAATLAGVLTFGGHLWDAVTALLVFATMWRSGRWLTVRMAPTSLQGVAVIDLVVGAVVLGLTVEVFGRLHIIEWWTAGVLVVLIGALGVADGARAARGNATALWDAVTCTPIAATAAGLIALQLGLAMVWLSAPDIMFDALYGKAYLPELWAHSHQIGPLVKDPALNLAGLTQVISTPGHSLGSVDVGRWLQDLSWLTVVATVWWWGGKRSAVGPVSALALALTPHLMWQNSTAFDDNVLMLPAAALTVAVFRSLSSESRENGFGSAVLLGLLGGAAIWFKLHLAVLAVVLLAGWVIAGGSGAGFVRRAVGALTGGLIAAAPAMILRWIDTGNPLFPSYNGIFKSEYGLPVNDKLNFPFVPNAGHFDWLRLPYDAVAHADRMSEAAPPGAYGLLVPVVALALLFGWRAPQRRPAIVAWIALLIALVAWWGQLRYLRYGIPIAMLSLLLLSTWFRGWRPGRASTAGIIAAGVVGSASFLPGTVAAFWNVPGKQLPFAAAFGRWDKHDYLRTVFPETDALDVFQAKAPEGARVATIAHERLFLEDHFISVLYEVSNRLQLLGPLPTDGDTAYRELRQLGVTWTLVDTNGTSVVSYPWLKAAVDTHGQIVFSDRGWSLYKFVAHPQRPTTSLTCDPHLRGARACWNGIDRRAGVAAPEVASRMIPACAGSIVGVRVTAAPGGAPSSVSIDSDGSTGSLGYTSGAVQPGTTSWIYATVPRGSANASISITPGAGGKIVTAKTGTMMSRCQTAR